MQPNDPMAALINSLPPPPANPNGGADIFGQPNPPMFGVPGPGAAPAAPAPYPQSPPAPAPSPYMQQPASFYPPAPAAPAPMPPAPQQPQQYPGQPAPQPPTGAPASEYPIVPTPLQAPMMPQQAPMPDWAQDVIDAAQALQNPQGDDWPDRPQTWGGLRQYMHQAAQEIASAQIQQWQADQAQAAQNAAAITSAENQRYDMAEAQLQQIGLLPAVTNPGDPNDPGRLAKRELYGYTIAMGGQGPENLMPAATALKALHDSGVYFDVQQNKLIRRGSQSAAAQAPIAGGAPVTGGPGQGGPAGPTQAQLGQGLGALAEIGMANLQ